MNYYFDTEFLEGPQKKRFLGITYGETKPTIDLISIGLVSSNNREYYAISKDFNLKEAWNRHDIIKGDSTMVKSIGDSQYNVKNYWIRENVLKPIFEDLYRRCDNINNIIRVNFTYEGLKTLISIHGKPNKQIAREIIEFVSPEIKRYNQYGEYALSFPKFYAYYADYDWVVFCWLFGKMIDLPKSFPMYCIDLKQMLDEKETVFNRTLPKTIGHDPKICFKKHINYPKQENEHNAIADARWNKKLHEFIKTL